MGDDHAEAQGKTQRQTVEMKWGKLRLATLAFAVADGVKPTKVSVKVSDKLAEAEHKLEGEQVRIALTKPVSLTEGERLEVDIT